MKLSSSENGFYNRNIQKRAKSVRIVYSKITCNLKSMTISSSVIFMNYSINLLQIECVKETRL